MRKLKNSEMQPRKNSEKNLLVKVLEPKRSIKFLKPIRMVLKRRMIWRPSGES